MKYMGSKRRIAKYILPIILKGRKNNQWYVEPLCGGCNSLDKVNNPRLANDSNKYLISFLKELQIQIPFSPPPIDELEYKNIQNNKDKYPNWLVGYVGFNLSFGGKFFGGYRRDSIGIRNYENEAIRNIRKQQLSLQGIDFRCENYLNLKIPDNSIIYCDPPYKGTTQYNEKFNYEAYYKWCIEQKNKGHSVFMSEYEMPDNFTCIWEMDISSNLDVNTKNRRKIEKLFIVKE